jgi:hypothetical protein
MRAGKADRSIKNLATHGRTIHVVTAALATTLEACPVLPQIAADLSLRPTSAALGRFTLVVGKHLILHAIAKRGLKDGGTAGAIHRPQLRTSPSGPVCTENFVRVDDVTKSPKLAE